MKSLRARLRLAAGLALTGTFLALPAVSAAPLTLYTTQFEPGQGFVLDQPVAGRDGWLSQGANGNGIVTNFVTGFRQSAYIGFAPANTTAHFLYRPVNFNPTNRPLVTFTVDWVLFDSSTDRPNRDDFRWSVYNLAGHRLFSLGFDNFDLAIHYQLDDGVFHETGHGFENSAAYALRVEMNFAANRWNAWLGDTRIVADERITTTNAARTFSDVSAVWIAGVPGNAGDNFLLFDNFTLTADTLPPVPPATPAVVQALGMVAGQFRVRVTGENGARYAIEASGNLRQWTALRTNVITGGFFEHLDPVAAGQAQRFYRARWVP